MRNLLRWIRAILLTLILLAVGIPASLFITLSIPQVQKWIKNNVQEELTSLLDSEVEIKDLAISPFNKVTLFDVSLTDINDSTAIKIHRLGAGISLSDLVFFGDWVVNYIEIIGMEGELYKETPEGSLNINNIIESLKPKNKREKKTFRLSINNIILRSINFSYNVLNAAAPVEGRFNKNHININNLRADISVPILSNEIYAADIYRLALEEQSGFIIDDLHGRVYLSSDSVTVSEFGINMPNSMLNFSDLKLEFNDSINFKEALNDNVLSFSTKDPSYITPADFSCFFGPLEKFRNKLNIDLNLTGTTREVILEPLILYTENRNGLRLEVSGKAFNVLDNDGRKIDLSKIYVRTSGDEVSAFIPEPVNKDLANIPRKLGIITFDGSISIGEKDFLAFGDVKTDLGMIHTDIKGTSKSLLSNIYPLKYSGNILFDEILLGDVLSNQDFGTFSGKLSSSGTIINKRNLVSTSDFKIYDLEYSGYHYKDIDLEARTEGTAMDALIALPDPNFNLNAEISMDLNKTNSVHAAVNLNNFVPSKLNLFNTERTYDFKGELIADLEWYNIDDLIGEINLSNVEVDEAGTKTVITDETTLTLSGPPNDREIKVTGDRVNVEITGQIFISALPYWIKKWETSMLPALFADNLSHGPNNDCDLKWEITLNETEWLTKFINLPISTLDRIYVSGLLNTVQGLANLDISAPYIRQGNKLIEQVKVEFTTQEWQQANLKFDALFPTKSGVMEFRYNGEMIPDILDSTLSWDIDNVKDYSGNVGFTTLLFRPDAPQAYKVFKDTEWSADIYVKEGTLAFNDSVWNINPSEVNIAGKDYFKINNFKIFREGQLLDIDGIISENSDDKLTVILDNIDLDYVFETLAIKNVTIGGDATGVFFGTALLSSEPRLITENLKVNDISYNKSVVGDAVINSGWNNEKRAIFIDADISQANGEHTKIRGVIFPLNDSLDMTFMPKKVQVGFLRPYVGAFTHNIDGLASGWARLYGNFKDIDLEARILADSVSMKIDFTNVVYAASDSVIIDPGRIQFDNLRVMDVFGHSARLNGLVTHKFFKQPEFEFVLSNADNLLFFDEPESSNPNWFGRVFADGNAMIKGGPGYVDISCDLVTSTGTTFSFVLNEMQNAGEYSFITFRDRDYLSIKDSLLLLDNTPQLVKDFKSRQQTILEEGRSKYDLDFHIDVTPDAQMTLVMDPEGGDRIQAYGDGAMRLTYGSNDEELKIFGTYTLQRGDYNFSLQEIIIKDFSIKEGSSISFIGDPYRATLDITAVYNLTANLSDLDAMFLEDKDISRTNVPVHALLQVRGDLHQPDISFDLEFPTLTQDTYRKVKSIISTEDMMNRQMIYLLALNRFYTPEYMQSATKGNEFISVASSTLSSQLSNILGQISDKWTISPSIKSERSDFADMEVDLALSSSLLNNRLLLNGNFGYRDKMLNTNQFIGDFDVEYLLNRKGTLRLKAYNRYNDRNFYYKTAATTQGVGVMIKHDFDSFLDFLKIFQKKSK